MNRLFLSKYIVTFLFPVILHAQMQPIGGWTEHLSFSSAQKIVCTADKFFVASTWGIFSVTYEDKIIERYSKVNGLSDMGIKTIQYDPSSEKLIIAYNNSNLDVLYRNDIINIPYIKRSNIVGDKNIYHIYMEGNKAYLSSGLGVVVVNLDKYEIQSTWPVGNNSTAAKVNAFSGDQKYFYAATNQGLKRILKTNNFPENHENWEILSNNNGLPSGEVKHILTTPYGLFAQISDRLFRKKDSNWEEVYNDGWQWLQVSYSGGMILICQNNYADNSKRVIKWDPLAGTVKETIQNYLISYPNDAQIYNNTTYIANLFGGVIVKDGESIEFVNINTPYGPLDGEMIFQNNKLYITGGSINSSWNYQYNSTGFFVYDQKEWKTFNQYTVPWMDTLLDIITIAVDPADETIYAGSYSGGLNIPGRGFYKGGGLIEMRSPTDYKIYKQGSSIERTTGDTNSYRVSGLALDNERNLWFTNFGAKRNLGVKKANGSMFKFTPPFTLNDPDDVIGAILIDDVNQKWIQVPKGLGLYCYNHGTSIDNPNDDQWKYFRTGKGNGNLPDDQVNAMAKDKDGFIWVGTDKGVGIIQCPGEVFSSGGCEAYQPVIQQDNFAGLLFGNETVKAIAVDGANRKWVGTKNGVWLISAEGEKVIERFTEENSPLISNEINRIAINQASGEVYFSTSKGICSYRGTATEGKEKHEELLIFPNPVRSGYNGQIGIRGLAANSFVKITEITGRLVYQTRAFGGQAVWNGRDYNGNRVATGVYLILVTDETGVEKTAGKIIFVK
jgi:hypothetical protein